MDYTLNGVILSASNVSAGYDGKTVIENVNILERDVNRVNKVTGQTIAVVGRSGRGKSTLFKVLTGLVKPMSGEILIADENGEAKVVEAGDVGLVDQKYTLFRHKTVYQTLSFALRNVKTSKADKDALIDSYLLKWKLTGQRDQYPNELSGGQRQRVAIIEQLLSSKRFIILDEPAASLDVGNIDELKSSIENILTTNELNTIIFSTHDINLAVELADSIYVIGYPEGVTDYSTIVKHYDLKAMGLAWSEIGDAHHQFVKELKDLLLKS
jgi:polar amino acid transport system ATP-binding protein